MHIDNIYISEKANKEKPTKENICAVFITYHPGAGFMDRVASVRKQVGDVVIVDNHSDDSELNVLCGISRRTGINLIKNDENLGVATALNQGIRWAKGRGFKWMLSLDQDSIPEECMVDEIEKAYRDYNKKEKIAVIGSYYWYEKRKKELNKDEHSWLEEKTVITSGSLISIDVYDKIGPFRDDFFIDHVDHEYCLRAISNGYKVLALKKIVIRHSIGSPTLHKLFGREYASSNQSPERRYYATRNLTLLVRENLFKETRWILDTLFLTMVQTVLMLLFEDRRLLKLRGMCVGFLDGIRGVVGKKPLGAFPTK
jgi:rhamnosyltransferase